MNEKMSKIRESIFALSDSTYRDFQSSLMPTVDKTKIIGVRTPKLRKLAKELKGSEEAKLFLRDIPHSFYEENNLHAFLIEGIKDFSECMTAVVDFLPYVDNWATCDSMNPKVFTKHIEDLEVYAYRFIDSGEVYTVRYGIGMLMRYFLDNNFELRFADKVASIKSDEYYIKMMVAWYFATALAKQYELIIPYLENHRLDAWTHNKTIQKALESFRITDMQKQYLKKFKII